MPNLDLADLGLTSDQSAIYLSLLDHGPQTASRLAQTTPVKRTYVYRLAQELEKLNLLTIRTQGQTTTFTPLSPSLLQTRLEAKQAQITSAKTLLNSLLPSLEAKYRLLDTKPVISYFEGLEGLKKTYHLICQDKNDILLLRSTFDEKNQPLVIGQGRGQKTSSSIVVLDPMLTTLLK